MGRFVGNLFDVCMCMWVHGHGNVLDVNWFGLVFAFCCMCKLMLIVNTTVHIFFPSALKFLLERTWKPMRVLYPPSKMQSVCNKKYRCYYCFSVFLIWEFVLFKQWFSNLLVYVAWPPKENFRHKTSQNLTFELNKRY